MKFKERKGLLSKITSIAIIGAAGVSLAACGGLSGGSESTTTTTASSGGSTESTTTASSGRYGRCNQCTHNKRLQHGDTKSCIRRSCCQ